MTKLVFVTQNKNKVNDAQKLLTGFEIEHIDFNVPEVQSLDLKEIAEYKIKFAYEKVKQPCFVMDTALSFDCLNGFPGPFIKWYWEKTVGAEKTCAIAELFGQYGCQFTTTLGYFDGDNAQFITETIEGQVADRQKGTNGFHWDTIFIPVGQGRTFAEMTFEEKHAYSVTGKILSKFKDTLNYSSTKPTSLSA